jgi:pimeloyl-ACP methyl ester carboxylesterase
MISEHRGHLLFISDHESDFTQIYDLDLHDKSLKRLYPSSHDLYSPKAPGERRYTFRINIDGNFIAGELRDESYAAISPTTGVVYDFSLDFGTPVLLYSNDRIPTSLVRMMHGRPMPLLPSTFDVRQPTAIPIRNTDGMTNFLYLPSGSPKGWLIWLHGGPHEQVSPRFNLYFDFLVSKQIAVYAINYPGSTGIGNTYELRGVREAQSIAIQLRAIERDLGQLRQLHHEISSLMLVGVSYSTLLGHLLLAQHPEITRFVDFSGVASIDNVPAPQAGTRTYPPMLFIYGQNDFALHQPGRLELISQYESRTSVRRLILNDEGHFIQRRGDIDSILRELDQFLAPAQQAAPGTSRVGPVAGPSNNDR